MIKTHQKMVDRLHSYGIYPKHQGLDDNISEAYKAAIRLNKVTFQQILSGDDQRNITGRGFQVAKDHLVSILCEVDKNCPMHKWD